MNFLDNYLDSKEENLNTKSEDKDYEKVLEALLAEDNTGDIDKAKHHHRATLIFDTKKLSSDSKLLLKPFSS